MVYDFFFLKSVYKFLLGGPYKPVGDLPNAFKLVEDLPENHKFTKNLWENHLWPQKQPEAAEKLPQTLDLPGTCH